MNNTFPGFAYKAELLSAYIFSIDMFVLSLVDEQIVRFTAEDPEAFRKWLGYHNVRDISLDTGSAIMKLYFERRGK